MCSIVLRIDKEGVLIGANRDEMIARPWTSPAAHWPEQPDVVAGRDTLAGGTWLGMNGNGVVAAVLNRHGSLGPAPGKRSRGELPLLALREDDAGAAAARIAQCDAGLYRSFNVVVADQDGGFCLSGIDYGRPVLRMFGPGTWMVTSGDPNDADDPRIARSLPRFAAAAFADWPALLADLAPPAETALNVTPHDGFGTVCSTVIALPRGGAPAWRFAAGPPHLALFLPIAVPASEEIQ